MDNGHNHFIDILYYACYEKYSMLKCLNFNMFVNNMSNLKIFQSMNFLSMKCPDATQFICFKQ